MRIISGEYRGRSIKAPKGSATRPTTDRVRESLMSSIMSARGGFDGAVVLDAFAGSGALGIEALSRGAAFACLCEKDPVALAALASNTSFIDSVRFRILRGDVTRQVPYAAHSAYDLVFLDPPYAMGVEDVGSMLAMVKTAGLLTSDALIAYEHDKKSDPAHHSGFLSLELVPVAHKVYGDTVVDLFRREFA
jgi:16S rRNA (guanine966-N2)-methyltransferase